MATKEISDLNELLFSSDSTPPEIERWQKQAFSFCAEPRLGFTLLQNYGGPCGVIASVQAFLCKNIILTKKPANLAEMSALSRSDIIDLLATSLTEIAVQSSPSKTNFKAVFAETPLSDEKGWEIHHSDTEKELFQCIQRHAEALTKPLGVLSFVYSVLLTRGLANVVGDMDNSSEKLIKRHGHCSQELVNLLLTGKAVSNVFDGVKTFPCDAGEAALRLGGVEERPAVGFLTTLEALGYVRSGENFKTPAHPVWVAASSSHYTTLFALDPALVRMSAAEQARKLVRRRFELFDQVSLAKTASAVRVRAHRVRGRGGADKGAGPGFAAAEAALRPRSEGEGQRRAGLRRVLRVLPALGRELLGLRRLHRLQRRRRRAVRHVRQRKAARRRRRAVRFCLCFGFGFNAFGKSCDEVERPAKAVMYHYDAEAGTRASGRLKEFEIEFEAETAPGERGDSFLGLLATKWPRCAVRALGINGVDVERDADIKI